MAGEENITPKDFAAFELDSKASVEKEVEYQVKEVSDITFTATLVKDETETEYSAQAQITFASAITISDWTPEAGRVSGGTQYKGAFTLTNTGNKDTGELTVDFSDKETKESLLTQTISVPAIAAGATSEQISFTSDTIGKTEEFTGVLSVYEGETVLVTDEKTLTVFPYISTADDICVKSGDEEISSVVLSKSAQQDAENPTMEIAISLLKDGTENEINVEIEDEKIATVTPVEETTPPESGEQTETETPTESAERFTITGLTEGETTLIVSLSKDTSVKKEIPVMVVRAIASTDIADIIVTDITDEDQPKEKELNKDFVYTDTSYTANIVAQTEQDFQLEFVPPADAKVTSYTVTWYDNEDADGRPQIVKADEISGKFIYETPRITTSPSMKQPGKRLTVRPNNEIAEGEEESGQVYTVNFNFIPEFITSGDDAFPEIFTAYLAENEDGDVTGLELRQKLEGFQDYDSAYPYTNEMYLQDLEIEAVVDDEEISEDDCFIEYEEDEDDASNSGHYFYFTPSKELEDVDITFTITDSMGASVSRTVKLNAEVDIEEPTVYQPKIESSSTSRMVASWRKAEDNDEIESYEIRWGRSKSSMNSYESFTKEELESTTASNSNTYQKTINASFRSGTTYYAQVVAYDRAGNSAESGYTEFRISGSSSSSSGSNSGSGSGSNSNSSSGITVPGNTTTPDTTNKFTDLDSYTWAQEQIEELAAAGKINGVSSTEFAPGNPIRRGDFLLMLMNVLDITGTATDNFTDVPEGSYYYDAIGLAKERGFVSGMGDGTFYPDRNITRQEMIKMTYTILNSLGKLEKEPSGAPDFPDSDLIADWAQTPIASLSENGLIQGDAAGYVNPLGTTTRAEAAVLIYRIWKL